MARLAHSAIKIGQGTVHNDKVKQSMASDAIGTLYNLSLSKAALSNSAQAGPVSRTLRVHRKTARQAHGRLSPPDEECDDDSDEASHSRPKGRIRPFKRRAIVESSSESEYEEDISVTSDTVPSPVVGEARGAAARNRRGAMETTGNDTTSSGDSTFYSAEEDVTEYQPLE